MYFHLSVDDQLILQKQCQAVSSGDYFLDSTRLERSDSFELLSKSCKKGLTILKFTQTLWRWKTGKVNGIFPLFVFEKALLQINSSLSLT